LRGFVFYGFCEVQSSGTTHGTKAAQLIGLQALLDSLVVLLRGYESPVRVEREGGSGMAELMLDEVDRSSGTEVRCGPVVAGILEGKHSTELD